MKFNSEKWNAERIKVETAIRELKHKIRREPRPVMEWRKGPDGKYSNQPTGAMMMGGTYSDYQALASWKEDATWLYIRRALVRNRIHRLKTVTHSPTGEKSVEEHDLQYWKDSQWDVVCDSYMLPDETPAS